MGWTRAGAWSRSPAPLEPRSAAWSSPAPLARSWSNQLPPMCPQFMRRGLQAAEARLWHCCSVFPPPGARLKETFRKIVSIGGRGACMQHSPPAAWGGELAAAAAAAMTGGGLCIDERAAAECTHSHEGRMWLEHLLEEVPLPQHKAA